MNHLSCVFASTLSLFLSVAAGPADPAPPDDLLTVAERSDFTATASYAEVVELLHRIANRSDRVRPAIMGSTVEGRGIPLAIIADPPVASAEEAKATGKPIIFAFGDIHAGEVCGKEALLILAREFALMEEAAQLEKLVVVLAPIYNADGNEQFDPENRPGQIGPEAGMGERRNAQGLDLNRDYVKLESPEARAMVRFLTEWDPTLTIDTHTTNGSRHRFALTYAAPLNPSGHTASIEYVRDRLLPEVTRRLRQRTGYETFFYGNFNEDQTAWATYSALPRFGGPYRGLRGQMSILSEAYAYASYEDRVKSTLEFVREILQYAAEHDEELLELQTRARRETIATGRKPQPDDVVGIRHRLAAFNEPAVIPGYERESDEPRDWRVVHLGRFEPTRSVRRPFAYIIPSGQLVAVEKLRDHGITVEPFSGDARIEVYTIDAIDRAERPFEKHELVRIEATARRERRSYDNAMLVRTGQPLGTLAVYLLEPESEDGLTAWNFFDRSLRVGEEFPVVRVALPEDM